MATYQYDYAPISGFQWDPKFELKCKKGTKVLPSIVVNNDQPYLTLLVPKADLPEETRTFYVIPADTDFPDGATFIDCFRGPNGYIFLVYEQPNKSFLARAINQLAALLESVLTPTMRKKK
jgi:hypothetical protein